LDLESGANGCEKEEHGHCCGGENWLLTLTRLRSQQALGKPSLQGTS